MVGTETSSSAQLLELTGRAGRRALVDWDRLAWGRAPSGNFDPSSLDALPEPARRWLTHAIEPGTPLWHGVLLDMHGRIRLLGWRKFRAVQIHALPRGYIWAARARFAFLPLSGYDRFLDGEAEMRWSLFAHLPVVTATGEDLARAEAGRAVIDAIFVPTAFLGPDVTWHEGSTPNSAVAEWSIGDLVLRPEITVARDGSLISVKMQRWSRPKGEKWGDHSYGGFVGNEKEFNGVRIPTTMRVGYYFGTERWARAESYRATITCASFF